MKSILFGLLFVSPTTYAAHIGIISDLDDTIKITNVSNPLDAFIRGTVRRRAFTGMTEFFKGTISYSGQLHILTASPAIIKPTVLGTLRANNIQFDTVTFKNPLRFEGKIPYKVRVIENIMEKNPDTNFILMGDDVDKDPEIFTEILKRHPERVIQSYVHVVRNRDIPEGPMIRYWTTADLAMREMVAGRMQPAFAEDVLNRLMREKKLKHIVPHFADCPTDPSVWEWQLSTELGKQAALLAEKIIAWCSSPKHVDAVEPDDIDTGALSPSAPILEVRI